MKTVVYLDVLLLVNGIIGYLLLTAAAWLTGAHPSWLRLLAGAVLSALSSLVLLCPPWPVAVQLLGKAGCCFVITAAVFGLRPRKKWLQRCAWLFLLHTAGAGAALLWLRQGGLLTGNNLAVYLRISPVLLVACVGAVYLLLRLCVHIAPPRSMAARQLSVQVGEGCVFCRTALDTGLSLRDPARDVPVLLVETATVAPLLTAQQLAFLGDWQAGRCPLPPGGFRLLPCGTALGAGVLPALSGYVRCGGRRRPITVAFAAKALNGTGAQALCGPTLWEAWEGAAVK